MNSKKILFSFLLLVGSVFAFVQCNKQTETAQPASAQKARTNKSGSNGVLVARDVNGTPQFTYTQQQMKDAIENAFTTAEGITVTADSTIYMVDEVNPQTNQTEYALLFPITHANGEREYIAGNIVKQNGEYSLMGRKVTCSPGDNRCPCALNFWGSCRCTAGGSGTCVKHIERSFLMESAVSELAN